MSNFPALPHLYTYIKNPAIYLSRSSFRIIKYRRNVIVLTVLMVPEVGLEPTRYCYRQILSLLRLPFRHIRITTICYHFSLQMSNHFYDFICIYITITITFIRLICFISFLLCTCNILFWLLLLFLQCPLHILL